MTFYSAAVGRPVILAASDPEGVDPASPIARFASVAPRLRFDQPLRIQLDRVLQEPQRARYERILTEATSAPGRSADLVRTLLYRLLTLPEPDEPAHQLVIPIPTGVSARPATAVVTATSVQVEGGTAVVRLERYPAALRLGDPPMGDSHLVVEWSHHDPRLLDRADALVADLDATGRAPREWIESTLRRYSGCAVAAVARSENDVLIGTRDGRLLTAGAHGSADGEYLPASAVVSAVLALLAAPVTNHDRSAQRTTVMVGPATFTVTISEGRGPGSLRTPLTAG